MAQSSPEVTESMARCAESLLDLLSIGDVDEPEVDVFG